MIIKAIPKASAKSEVPRKSAFVASRTSPKVREIRVKTESWAPAASKDFFFMVAVYHRENNSERGGKGDVQG